MAPSVSLSSSLAGVHFSTMQQPGLCQNSPTVPVASSLTVCLWPQSAVIPALSLTVPHSPEASPTLGSLSWMGLEKVESSYEKGGGHCRVKQNLDKALFYRGLLCETGAGGPSHLPTTHRSGQWGGSGGWLEVARKCCFPEAHIVPDLLIFLM